MIKNILQFLEVSALNYPNKVAYADDSESITYRELVERAKRIGTYIAKNYACRNAPILVQMEKSPKCICAFFGVVYSGNFYVPLDISVPRLRLEKIISLLETNLAIIDYKALNLYKTQETEFHSLQYEELVETPLDQEVLKDIRNTMIDTDPLYLIFTSGSTGVPKGVTISHRSTIEFIENFTQTFSINAEDVFANQAPFDFDVSVKDIYSTLKVGATMHIIPKKLFVLLPKLMHYFNEKQITIIIWAVSAMTLISTMKGFEIEVPRTLKKVMFSGEVMPTKQLNIWMSNLPETMFVNLYGPTEITCNCLYYIVNRKFDDSEQIPLGHPFNNTDILVLNDSDQVISSKEIGEICVRGSSLALGYYNNLEITQKAFVQNPLNQHYPELIYRTGDLGRYNDRGELVYASRRDSQIKHMGHRIELGEIEFAVNSLEGINISVCMFDKNKNKIILVYQSDTEFSAKYILDCLKDAIPKYMFPHEIIYTDKMPLNKNGKVDRVLLKSHYITQEN